MTNIPILTNATANGTGSTVDLVTTAGGAIIPLANVTVTLGGGECQVQINTGMVADRIAPIKNLTITEDSSFQIPIGVFASATITEYKAGNIHVDFGIELK